MCRSARLSFLSVGRCAFLFFEISLRLLLLFRRQPRSTATTTKDGVLVTCFFLYVCVSVATFRARPARNHVRPSYANSEATHGRRSATS